MSKGLSVGSVFPDYELPDENGVKHRLSDLQGDNALILQLGRGEHCPRERQHHRELLKLQDIIPVAFTSLVTILPNGQHDCLKMKIATGAWWTFLSDEDLSVQAAHEIDEYTDTHHDATVPHTLVLGDGLRIEKVYCGYWYWGRPSVGQLWTDLQDLLQRTKADFDPTTKAARGAWKRSQTTDLSDRAGSTKKPSAKKSRTASKPASSA